MCWALSPGEKIYSVTLENGSKEENGEITRYFQKRPIVKKEKPVDRFCGLSLLVIALVISAIDIEKSPLKLQVPRWRLVCIFEGAPSSNRPLPFL